MTSTQYTVARRVRSTTCGSKPSARTCSRRRLTPLISLNTPSDTRLPLSLFGMTYESVMPSARTFVEDFVRVGLRRDGLNVDPVTDPDVAFGDALQQAE